MGLGSYCRVLSLVQNMQTLGRLFEPLYMMRSSNDPQKQVKAAFHSSFSLMWTLLYPHLRSIFVNNLAPWSLSTRCAINSNVVIVFDHMFV